MKEYSGYIIIAAFLFLLSLIFYSIDEIFIDRTLDEAKIFEIKKGEDAKSVIDNLKEAGLVRNKFIVRTYIVLTGIHKEIRPGLYSVAGTYSVKQIFDDFVKGAGVKVRIFEGWTTNEIAQALKDKEIIENPIEFLRLAKNFDNSNSQYSFLPKDKKIDLEGYLFPDTYKLERLSSAEVIERMLDNFDTKVYSLLENKPYDELRNILIMASFLEREVKSAEDMKLVSGILWKRFESEIPLQVDATLVYIKCFSMNRSEDDKTNCRILTNGDRKLDSLYNTYLNKGLPPGPISNPGLKAIAAAISPLESPYWYYLSAKDDGRTIFARTLEEHNLNRAVYR